MKREPTELNKKEPVLAVNHMVDWTDEGKSITTDICYKWLKIAFKEGQSSPKIKQLEWVDTDMWYFKAKTSLGLGYSITEIKGTYIVDFGDAPISWEKSLESAKAAAQADFERRVLECLE